MILLHDLGRRLAEAGMDAGGDEVQAGEHLVGQVEPAVGEDVHLDAGEQPYPFDAGVERPDLLLLGHQPLGSQTPGHGQRLGVVAEAEVVEALVAGGEGHLLQSGPAVGPVGVDVEVAPQIAGDPPGPGAVPLRPPGSPPGLRAVPGGCSADPPVSYTSASVAQRMRRPDSRCSTQYSLIL